MYRIALTCSGIPLKLGEQLARDVAEEFGHRPWHKIVKCQWEGDIVTLVGENDFDDSGDALADEFSDAVAASYGGGYSVRIV
jgi:hypothetical protein